MANPNDVLQSILQKRVGFEIISQNTAANQIRYFGRVRPTHMPIWLEAMRQLLLVAGHGWSLDLSKQYFLRGDKLFFGWRIILQAQDLAGHLPAIIDVLQRVQIAPRELDEVRLHAGPDRNALRNGKGAQPMGSAVVGPAAKAQLGM